jgi:hypothetical protein
MKAIQDIRICQRQTLQDLTFRLTRSIWGCTSSNKNRTPCRRYFPTPRRRLSCHKHTQLSSASSSGGDSQATGSGHVCPGTCAPPCARVGDGAAGTARRRVAGDGGRRTPPCPTPSPRAVTFLPVPPTRAWRCSCLSICTCMRTKTFTNMFTHMFTYTSTHPPFPAPLVTGQPVGCG